VDRGLGIKLRKVGVVLSPGKAGDFDEDIAESPTILLDPKTGLNVMVYVGYNLTPRGTIGYATSPDLLNWSKQGQLLPQSGTPGAPDENGCSGPLLLWDSVGSQYVLYYIGLTLTGYEAGTKTLCYATATTLTGTWTRHGSVISPTGTGWRRTAIWHPSIIQRGSTWYCFFNATGDVGAVTGVERIGYATAPSITGPWTVDDTNSPLLDLGGPGWDSQIVGDPSVRRVGNLWVMDYYGSNGTNARDGVATTSDAVFPLGWVKYASNPILSPTTGTYDGQHAHKPFTIQRGGEVFHYYTAVNAANLRQIALAVSAQGGPPSLDRLPAVTGLTADGTLLASLVIALRSVGLSVNIGTIVASDDFGRANNALMGSTPVGAKAWVSGGGAGWVVGGQQAAWAGAADGAIVINSGVYDNYALQFTMRQVTGAYPIAIVARGTSATVYVKIYYSTPDGCWILSDGVNPLLYGAAATAPNVGDVLRVEVTGTTYKFYVNTVLHDTFTGVTTHNTASDTFQGIGGNGAIPTAVDDFSVASI